MAKSAIVRRTPLINRNTMFFFSLGKTNLIPLIFMNIKTKGNPQYDRYVGQNQPMFCRGILTKV